MTLAKNSQTPSIAKFEYVGQHYKQGNCDLDILTFCASANDIFKWSGVPAKTERFHGGFQRALSDRFHNIKRFFDDKQSSPTSVVVAFRKDILNTTSLGYPGAWPKSEDLSNTPSFVHLSFEFPDYSQTTPLQHLIDEVVKDLKCRLDLSTSGNEQEQDDESEQEPDEDSNDEEVEDTQESEAEDEDELDVGHSKLKSFYRFLTENEKLDDWLKEENSKYEKLKQKDRRTKKEIEYISISPENRLKSLLISILRPAMIVDGQHRIHGAYESDHAPITFTVCAIKDADWIEQVFQFIVLNKLAKPISPSFLTGLLNTSLTNSEVKDIEGRMENIGIKNTDRVIMKYLNHDDSSPFFGMVAEAGEIAWVDNRGKLSDKGMIRLAKRWRNLRNKSLEIKMFIPSLEVNSQKDAKGKWKTSTVWTDYFFAFWKSIKKLYDNESDDLWQKKDKYHLLSIVTMHAMQDLFLESKASGDARFQSVEDFCSQVEDFFKPVPAAFFMNWKATGLQSGEGPDWIKEAIKSFRKGKRLGTVHDESPLFKDPEA